jgi:hypothetical protein
LALFPSRLYTLQDRDHSFFFLRQGLAM